MTLLWLATLAISPQALLDEAAQVEKNQATQRIPYVYRERQMNWSLDANGQKKNEKPYSVKVYEYIFLEGAPYRQLIERNGKLLSGDELAKREDARKKEAARRQEQRRLRKPFLPGTRRVRLGKLEELAAVYHLKDAGEEMVGDVPCLVIDAEPNGTADTPLRKELQSYRQRLWIHRDLKLLVQRRAEVIGPDSEILPGSVITFKWAPLADSGGTWFETAYDIDFGAKIFGVKKARGLQRHEFYDYRRFQVESTITAEPPAR